MGTGCESPARLDHRITASDTSTRCSFDSVSERVSPGRISRSPESRHPVQEKFQIVPWPWKAPVFCYRVGQFKR